ncbi:MAG: hypothetical protein WAN75_51125 [Xanthobacteraceae bacterium]|jgi:hypothetical protein
MKTQACIWLSSDPVIAADGVFAVDDAQDRERSGARASTIRGEARRQIVAGRL